MLFRGLLAVLQPPFQFGRERRALRIGRLSRHLEPLPEVHDDLRERPRQGHAVPAPETFGRPRRADEGLLRICVNVLAILVVVWKCREEFPELGQALEQRRRLVELRDEAEAVALLERPKGNAENHVWRRRVLPTSRWTGLVLRLTVDLPHTLSRRLGPSGYFRGRLAAEPYTPRDAR